MHLRRPRPRGGTALAVLAAVVVLLAGCGAIDRRLSAPAAPGETASATASPATPSETTAAAMEPTAPEPSDDRPRVAGTDGSDAGSSDSDASDTRDHGQDGRGDSAGRDQQPHSSRGDTRDGDGQRSEDRDAVDAGITRTLRRGDSGAQVRRLQRRLRDLHYWVGPIDGVYGQLTQQAVFAFQGVEGLAVDGVTGPNTRAALTDASPPTPRSDSGDLIEVDERARVVLDVRDGQVRWAWHTSTGTNETYQHPAGHTALAETPDGRHTIGWQVDGWRRNELGRLWRPKYFHPDGIALHGFSSVPATPSSHGCVRLTRAAMDFIWANDIAPKGSTVWVYGRAP